MRQRSTGPAVLLSYGGQTNLLDRSTDAALPVTAARSIVASRPGYSGTPLAGRTTPGAAADVFATVLDALSIDTVVAAAPTGTTPLTAALCARQDSNLQPLDP